MYISFYLHFIPLIINTDILHEKHTSIKAYITRDVKQQIIQ